jgi:hypothetical protein
MLLKNFKDDDRKLSKSNELQLEFFITSDKDANVVIEIRNIGYRNSLFVQAGTIKNVKIDVRAQVRNFDQIEENQGIHYNIGQSNYSIWFKSKISNYRYLFGATG